MIIQNNLPLGNVDGITFVDKGHAGRVVYRSLLQLDRLDRESFCYTGWRFRCDITGLQSKEQNLLFDWDLLDLYTSDRDKHATKLWLIFDTALVLHESITALSIVSKKYTEGWLFHMEDHTPTRVPAAPNMSVIVSNPFFNEAVTFADNG